MWVCEEEYDRRFKKAIAKRMMVENWTFATTI